MNTRKNIITFQAYKKVVLVINKDFLMLKRVGRTFRLVNSKYKDWYQCISSTHKQSQLFSSGMVETSHVPETLFFRIIIISVSFEQGKLIANRFLRRNKNSVMLFGREFGRPNRHTGIKNPLDTALKIIRFY